MSQHDREPTRTCVICRRRFPQSQLARHVLVAGEEQGAPKLVPDGKRRQPGRGVYVCPDAACREKFVSYRGGRKKGKGVRGE